MRRDSDDGRTRRGLLRTLGAVGAAGVAGMAGCTEVASRRYEAAPVGLDGDAGELGYHALDVGTWEVERSAEVSGIEMDATLVNRYAAYERGGRFDAGLGFLATPVVEEAGRDLNPLADRPFDEVLTGDAAAALLARLDLGIESDLAWERGPERVDEREVEFLGQSTEAAAFAGVTDGDEAVLLHVARVTHEGDVVFAVRADVPSGEAGALSSFWQDGIAPGQYTAGEDRPDRPLSSHGWSLDEHWHRYDDGLGHGKRIDPCLGGGLRWVEITKPDDRGIVVSDGSTSGGYQFPVGLDSYPYAEVTATATTEQFPGPCGRVPGDFDHYEWSYRRVSTNGWGSHCGPQKGKWIPLGTGPSATVKLGQCDCGITVYEIRVQGIDSNGNVASTDTIRYNVDVHGC